MTIISHTFIHWDYSHRTVRPAQVRKRGAFEERRDGRKVFGFYVLLSNLEPRRLKGSENQWPASPEERNARAANLVRLMQAGVDIITVQKLLGHSKVTMTERYTHSLADVKMAAVRKLDLAGVCSAPDPNRTPSTSGAVAETDVNSFAAST